MTKPMTYRKPCGEWGIEGVDLSTLPPKVYGALARLMWLEHPVLRNRTEALRISSEEEVAEMLVRTGCMRGRSREQCEEFDSCKRCWMDWLHQPAEVFNENSTPQRDKLQWKDWMETRFERGE